MWSRCASVCSRNTISQLRIGVGSLPLSGHVATAIQNSIRPAPIRLLHAASIDCAIARRSKTLSDYQDEQPALQSDGLVGEKEYEWSRGNDHDQMPSMETHLQSFNGTPYTQIPICIITATKNNTKIKFISPGDDAEGLLYTSATLEGFKNAKKKSETSGQTVGLSAGLRALRRNIKTCRVVLKGLGPGRLSAINGLVMAGVHVVSITDRTQLPEMGGRPKKARRL